MKRTHVDLFAGIGGFSLAAHWAGYQTVQFVEIEPFCQTVLSKHWPEVPIHADIRTFDGRPFAGTVDLLTGGFPCQPYSVAGKRRGDADDRALWPEMARVIGECRPRWVVGENPTGLVGMALDRVLDDLASLDYEAWPVVIEAASLGAWHHRPRVWIIAHANGARELQPQGRVAEERGRSRDRAEEDAAESDGLGRDQGEQPVQARHSEAWSRLANDEHPNRERHRPSDDPLRAGWDAPLAPTWWQREPPVARLVHGLSRRLARRRVAQVKALGNAIVPQIAYEIIQRIPEEPQTPEAARIGGNP